MFKAWGKDSYSEVVEHAALAVLDRSGHSHANVRVYYRSNWRIKDFAARTIDANGVVHEVTPDRIYDDAAINQSDKDDGLNVRVFAFPRVAEGSVLEYRYVLHLPYLRHLYWEYCVDDVPVIAYDLTLKISEDAICLLKIYNTRHDIQKSTEGNLVVLKWRMTDLMPPKETSFLPNRQFHSPWWLLSIVQYSYGMNIHHISTTWEHALQSYQQRLVRNPQADLKGFRNPLPSLPNESVRETIQRAFRWVQDNPAWGGWGSFEDQKPLADVVTVGRADNFERARLLQHVLSDGFGIRADVALLRRNHSGVADKNVPSSMWMNHMTVVVPAQKGIEEELWLDPSCSYCEPGHLPWWVSGASTIVLDMERHGTGEKPRFRFDEPKGDNAVAETFHRRFDVNLDTQGHATGMMHVHLNGDNKAQYIRQARDESERKRRERLVGYLRNRIPGAQLTEWADHSGENASDPAGYRIGFQADEMGTRAKDALIVPLDFLHHGREKEHWPEQRTETMLVVDDEVFVEEVAIHGPAGYEVRVKERAETIRGDHFQAELRVEGGGEVLTVFRSFRMSRGSHSPEEYERIRGAIQKIAEVRQMVATWEPASVGR